MANAAPSRAGRTSNATRILLALTLLGAVSFALLLGVTIWLVMRSETAEVAEGSFLRVELEGGISDAPEQLGIFSEPGEVAPTPTEMARGIRRAGDDTRIKGLYLDMQSPTLGWANTKELRDAVVAFRASGKPCIAYGESYETQSYYLASACDRIVLAPSGLTFVAGIGSSVTYYAGLFEKIGVVPDFEHVGDFKSAIEVYERTGPSEPAQESYNLLFDGLWGTFLADVSAGRGRTPEEIQALVDHPPLSPSDALERGLVDVIAYPDAVAANLADVTAADWPEKLKAVPPAVEGKDDKDLDEERFTDIGEYVKDIRSEDKGKTDQIAVVYAEGTIVSGGGGGGPFSDAALADGPFEKWMRTIREDDDIKAVVLRINSPGGSGLASDNMWREIQILKATGKPVVVSMANYAASGGYYIAAPADWIVAEPTTLTGSIGVFGGKLTIGGTYEKIGLTQFDYKRGEMSDLLSMTHPFTEEGRTVFRSYLEDFYAQFLSRVAEGRHKTSDEIHVVAQGRVWTGQQALDRGLVDELGGLDVAVKKAAELAKITDYGLHPLPEQKDFFEQILEDLDSAQSPTVQVRLPVPGADAALDEVFMLQRVLSDNGVAAYLPGEPVPQR